MDDRIGKGFRGRQPANCLIAIMLFLIMTAPALSAGVQYTYDHLGRLTEVTYEDGATITYTYDAMGNRIAVVVALTDTDGDGMSDDFENTHAGLDPNDPSDANLDFDQDGLTNVQEFLAGSDPNNPDTDGDGRLDGVDFNPAFDEALLAPIIEMIVAD